MEKQKKLALQFKVVMKWKSLLNYIFLLIPTTVFWELELKVLPCVFLLVLLPTMFFLFCFIFQRRAESLAKEKEQMSKENQALSKLVEELKQGRIFLRIIWYYLCILSLTFEFFKVGRRSSSDITGDQVMKEKEEKDTRIQVLNLILYLLPCSLFSLFVNNFSFHNILHRFWKKLWRGKEKSWRKKRMNIRMRKQSV